MLHKTISSLKPDKTLKVTDNVKHKAPDITPANTNSAPIRR